MARQPSQEVIDLTADSPEQTFAPLRPRRRSHSPRINQAPRQRHPDVIDLLDTPETPRTLPYGYINESGNGRRADTPAVDLTGPTPIDVEDDEIQFISENPVQQPYESTAGYLRRLAFPGSGIQNRPHRTSVPHHHPPPHLQQRGHYHRRTPPRQRQRHPHSGILQRLISSFQRAEDAANDGVPAYRPDRSIQRTRSGPFGSIFVGTNFDPSDIPPMVMDYTAVPFSVNTGQPPRPTYEAPPAAPNGFTRSPREGDVVVCPNCDHELGHGEEFDKQIWVSKDCGHVYCGVCAHTKKVGRKKAQNIPTKEARPREQVELDTCVVDGCGVKLATKGKLFQVYV